MCPSAPARATCLVFIHLGSRKVFHSPSTYHPNSEWVMQQARNTSMWMEDDDILEKVVDCALACLPPQELRLQVWRRVLAWLCEVCYKGSRTSREEKLLWGGNVEEREYPTFPPYRFAAKNIRSIQNHLEPDSLTAILGKRLLGTGRWSACRDAVADRLVRLADVVVAQPVFAVEGIAAAFAAGA